MRTKHKRILNLHHLIGSLLAPDSAVSINRLLAALFLLILIGSFIGISLAIFINSYWTQHPIQAASAFVGIALLSSYVVFLILRLQNKGSGTSSSTSLAHQGKPRSEADCSLQNKLSSKKSEVQRSQQRRILVLSSNPINAEEIGRLLQNWHHAFTLCRTTAQAFHRLLNGVNDNSNQPYDILLVDQRALEIDPLLIASIIHQEPLLLDTALIYLGPPQQEEQRQNLQNVGYSQLLEAPVKKSLLFAAISTTNHIEKPAQHVVSLVSRLGQQSDESPPRDILLAEPNPLDRRMFERLLKHAGHKVYCVENGDQALDALEGHHFDLAIIDLEIPVINGLQIAKLHRFTHVADHWIPFIAIVRHKTPQTLNECKEAKIEACLARPVLSSELLKAVKVVTSQDHGVSTQQGLLSSEIQCIQTETSSHNLHLLDASVLEHLERLDKSQDFLNGLISTFIEEGETYLQQMREAMHNNRYQAFIDTVYLLVDSSGQLGAASLYRYSLCVSRARPDELKKTGTQMLDQLDGLFIQTKQAFLEYMASHDRGNADQK